MRFSFSLLPIKTAVYQLQADVMVMCPTSMVKIIRLIVRDNL